MTQQSCGTHEEMLRTTLNDAEESSGLWHPRGAALGCSERSQGQEGSAAPGAPGFQQSLGVPRASPRGHGALWLLGDILLVGGDDPGLLLSQPRVAVPCPSHLP